MQHRDIHLKPSMIFAFINALPYMLTAAALLFLAWQFYPYLIPFSLVLYAIAIYRICLLRSRCFSISGEFIRVRSGIKRTDQSEMFRIRDFMVTKSQVFQLFNLMELLP